MNLSAAISLEQTDAIAVDQSDIKGEPGTGFEKRGDLGPFECGNCHFYQKGFCAQSIMRKVSHQPHNADGDVKVGAHDCCEYVSRIG